ncbi:MAG: VWA domain-containing protein [Neisseriaceae bacterium]|nr:MAG: VWA domain-containing protein [Neisseriaceae bacterium]
MLIDFFFELRRVKIPVSIREWLDLIKALEQHIIFASIDDFYQISRLILIKNEKYYDKFDQVFAYYFEGVAQIDLDIESFNIPKEWLVKQLEKYFTPQELENIKSQGDLNKLMELFKQRLREQKKRHQGGNKWIGTAGISPFGAFGYNPEGFRIDQFKSNHRKAIKVWEKRQFKDLDEDNQLDTRNMQLALRRLRILTKNKNNEILDLGETIKATAKNAGLLDIKNQYERHNAVKVLLFFDVGGSMDDYVYLSRQLFQAVKNEFKNMVIFYFHNCVYEFVWQNNERRYSETILTNDIIRRYESNYKVIFVGDASMSPYEINYPGGSVEHFNQEPGRVWINRITNYFNHVVWLNPVQKKYWGYTPSIGIMRELVLGNMYPLTIEGIIKAIKSIS